MLNKKILITGLCLSRNRGGPAMALSFIDQIRKRLPADFTFAVDPLYFDLEKEWALKYGVKVVPRDNILQFFFLLRRFKIRLADFKFWHKVHKEYQKAFRSADCVIDLSGISFVGDGTRSWFGSLISRTPSIYARRHNKKFFRFIQSYGPFKDWRVRILARKEFKDLPCIMARGQLSANYCKEIIKSIPVYNFPDVAIALKPASKEWLDKYLKQLGLKDKNYIVFSPSAVIASFSTDIDSSVGKKHISVFSKIAEHYLIRNQSVLFVPHMTSPKPSQCDRCISEEIIRKIREKGIDMSNCYIVDDELDCQELKAIIGGAKLAVVSRYHALVAALSSAVPVVSVGWNDKYKDLLDFYKSAQFAVDARNGEPSVIVESVLEKINNWTAEQILLVKNEQSSLEEMVDRAGKICADWIIKKPYYE